MIAALMALGMFIVAVWARSDPQGRPFSTSEAIPAAALVVALAIYEHGHRSKP